MANIEKLHKQLEKDNQEVVVEIEVITEDSPYFNMTPEEWELYEEFEARKGNKVIHLTGKEANK